jgi:hypothetical protein
MSHVIPNITKILSKYVECIRVVWVDLAQLIPVHLHLLMSFVGLLPEVIQNIQIWHNCGQVGPEFDLKVAYLFDCTLHLPEESFELDHIGELWIHMLVLEMILLNKFLNYGLVPEYRELLLEARFLLLGYIQLYQRGMYVSHHFELVERKGDVDAWAVHKLYERFFIQFHDEMLQEDLVQMKRV